jgi:hypothetical protein
VDSLNLPLELHMVKDWSSLDFWRYDGLCIVSMGDSMQWPWTVTHGIKCTMGPVMCDTECVAPTILS